VAVLGPGHGVDGHANGDAVFGLMRGDGHGGHAQLARVHAPQTGRHPPSIDVDHASGPTVAGATTMLLLRETARLQPGGTMLVPERTDSRGVGVPLESCGGETLAQGLRSRAPFGRAIVNGAASGRDAVVSAATLRAMLDTPAPNQRLAAETHRRLEGRETSGRRELKPWVE
jgi:NADPH:quinone reductase-like Zn-dependent oxidoreductase